MIDMKTLRQEPSLEALLSDPIIIAVMHRDGLAPGDVQRDMEAIATRLRSQPVAGCVRAA